MKLSLSTSIALVAAFLGTAQAGLFPTVPAPKQVLKPGDKVTITWSSDATTPAIPKTGDIEVLFMTGPDQTQIQLQSIGNVSVATTTLDWTVPQVTPGGLIYFLMFKASASATAEWWTTRFIVTLPDGTYPPPPTVTYASGKNPGGVGALVPVSAAATPAPAPSAGAGATGASPPSGAGAASSASNNAAPAVAGSQNSVSSSTPSATPTKSGAAVTASRANGVIAAGLTLALSVGLMLVA